MCWPGCDEALLDDLLSDVDAGCHQAAMVGHGVDPSDAPDYARHNDLATAVLLAAILRRHRGRRRCSRGMHPPRRSRFPLARTRRRLSPFMAPGRAALFGDHDIFYPQAEDGRALHAVDIDWMGVGSGLSFKSALA